MKAKYALIALLAITFFGCDDNTAGLGLGMFPGSDQNINGHMMLQRNPFLQVRFMRKVTSAM